MDNTDDLIARIQADELEDAPLITPVNYGRLRGIAPQLIYYYIRSKKLVPRVCPCGRKCIDKEEADAYLRKIGKLPPLDGQDATEETSGAAE